MPLQNDLFERVKASLAAHSSQAFLISGAKGAGKLKAARHIAQYILCEAPLETQACGQCAACRYFLAGNHPDFYSLEPAPEEKLIKVAAVRESLLSDTVMKPQFGKSKVYIIAADYLNEQGQNALLKTLEEPPPYAFFILTVQAAEKLLPTVRSRVIPLHIPALKPQEMQTALAEAGYTIDLQEAAMLTALSDGAAGQAEELLASPWFMELRSELIEHLLQWPLKPRYLLLTEEFEFFNAEKEHYDELLRIMMSVLRDLLALQTGAGQEQLLNRDFADALHKFTRQKHYDVVGLQAISAELELMQRGREVNENFEMSVCELLLQFEKYRL